MGKIEAVCTSEVRGVLKKNVGEGRLVQDFGLEGDAHGGNWHRQISLLAAEDIAAFREKLWVEYGAFGENLVTSGVDLAALPVGARLAVGEALLEVTQRGKECHNDCAIRRATGDCIMPVRGLFAQVLRGGSVRVGQEITALPPVAHRPYRAAVITLSDKGSRGERADTSGPAIADRLTQNGYQIVESLLLPDDRAGLESQLRRLCDQRQPDLILTTGGTGFGPRDQTPEATLAVAERNAPGIAEAIRAYSLAITPRAMLSRGASVIRGRTLIINLPGSTKAVRESMDCFLDTIPHALDLLRNEVGDCAR